MASQTGATSKHAHGSSWSNSNGVAVMDAVDVGVVVAELDGRIGFANALARSTWGAHASLEAMFPKARFGGSFRTFPEAIANACERGQPIDLTFTSCCGDGLDAIGVESRCTVIGHGARRCAVLSLRERCGSGDHAPWEEEEVSRRLASLGKVAAQVAHELNNPLDGILRYLNLALRMAEHTANAKLQDYLNESRTGLVRMVSIIGDLLEFARIGTDESEQLGVNEVVEQAIRDHCRAAEMYGVVVASDYQNRAMPEVRGNRLRQVCGNLIKNSIEAMPDGGRLTITTGMIDDENVVIRVADTGPGLPADTEKVFQPFFTTKEPGQGTGIGLAICKDFIEDMGGTISASAGVDGGAVFTIRLPKRCFRTAASRQTVRSQPAEKEQP